METKQMSQNKFENPVDVREVYRRLGRELPQATSNGWATTRCLNPQHPDEHPSCSVNVQSGGWKTLLATLISILVDGRPPYSITYTADGAEFEKQLATRVNQGDNVVLIDNIDVAKVKSAALDRSVTGRILNFRRLGTNEQISMPNTALYQWHVKVTQRR